MCPEYLDGLSVDPDKDYWQWLEVACARCSIGETKRIDPAIDGVPRMLLQHSEQILCCACLLNKKHARLIMSRIKPTDFLPGPNMMREIYAGILRVIASGKELNRLTVSQELSTDESLVQRAMDLPLVEVARTKPNVEYYIRLVQERIKKKHLYNLGVETSEKSRNGQAAKDIAKHIQGELSKIVSENDLAESADLDEMILEHDNFVEKLRTGELIPFRLPYPGLEDVVLYTGNQVVIAAHTSVGKSAFTLNTAIDYARHGRRVLWVTTEMTRIEMIQRISSCVAGIGVGLLRQNNIKLDNHAAVLKFKREVKESGGAIKIFYNSITTEADIQGELEAMEVLGGCDALFIDYIQDMQSVQKFRDNKDRITYISSWLRREAASRGMALFVISQLSRPGKDDRYTRRKPTIWDLKETGAIENKTEVVILLHRTDNTPNIRDWNINVEVAKNRNGNRCETSFTFDSWSAEWTI